MTGRGRAFQRNPELQRFVLPDVRPTGKQLGVGSYGSVEELEVNGLVCAGKRLHDALLQRDNVGVQNIERKYLEECKVMPTRNTTYNCLAGQTLPRKYPAAEYATPKPDGNLTRLSLPV